MADQPLSPSEPLSVLDESVSSPGGLSRQRLFLLGGGLALTVLTMFWLPGPVWDLLHAVGYAVCHQLPAHSFFLDRTQLPLCARCSGTFLGAIVSLGAIIWRGRTRAGNLPSVPMLVVLFLFFVAWALDGVNSYVGSILLLPNLYEPNNVLRVATGLANGVALTNLAMPVFHITVWKQTTQEAPLQNWRELGMLLLVALVLGALLEVGPPVLLGPAAFWSAAGVVALLTVVNTVIVVVAIRRESAATSFRDLLAPLAAGLLLTAGEIAAIGWGRAWLTERFGLPL